MKLWPILVTLETSEPGVADASDSAPATATMPMTVHPTATMPVFKSIALVGLVGFRQGKTAMCGDALSKKYQNSLNSLKSHQSGDLIPADGVSRPFESAFSVNRQLVLAKGMVFRVKRAARPTRVRNFQK